MIELLVGAAALALVVAIGWLAWVRLHTLLTYFQQEEYDSRRFIGAVLRVRLFDVRASIVLAALAAVRIAVAPTVRGVTVLAAAVLAGAALIAFIAWRERAYAYKKPLVMTERARRIRNIAAILSLLAVAAALFGPLMTLIALQLLPLALIGANGALAPMQRRVNEAYVAEARAKLARLDPVRIGITGSFGKTTTKHIFAELLGTVAPVFYSRGSINTVLGLTRHIRERLQFSHRFFIAEMGAYGIGSIARLCDFVEPDFGIVTAIGDAHTERFGSVENIAKAKSELVEYVCEGGGTAIVSTQVLAYAPFRRLRELYRDEIVTVGREEDADIGILSAELRDANWHIVLEDRREEPSADQSGARARIAYLLPLLGEHNVMNSALAVAAVHVIDPAAAKRLPLVTRDVEQVPHRLQKRESPGEPLVLDDAYNANEQGFRNAVEVAAELAGQRGGRAIIVTPGIAELGIEHERVHASLGSFAAEHAAIVYVVNPTRIPSFTAALAEAGCDMRGAASFADARAALRQEARAEDVILYENDLPDLLEEKRLL